MTKVLLIILFTVFTVTIIANPLLDDKKIKEKVEKLLSKMTLEEKVGQMTQITLEVISEKRESDSDPLVINEVKLREAILTYKIGSIINTGGAANSVENWHYIIKTIQDLAIGEETTNKIPILYGIDAIHGANYTLGATLFPQSIGMAATRNTELMKKAAEITSVEIRACGIPWNFNPVLGMGREPLWPRFWETFGEDVYLTSEMGRAYVIGQQEAYVGKGNIVSTCMKHYLGYSVPKSGNDRTPAWIPFRMLHDIFVPPFKAAVEAGTMTVMVNSGEINGIPTHSDKYLLTDLLKKELGFNGFIVSDWEDIKRLYDRDKVASTPKEAVKISVLAGMDMSMVPYDYSFAEHLIELVNDGEVPMERIDDAVRRILSVKFALGIFENPYHVEELVEKFASEEFTKINLQSAEESVTLLKNKNNVLPLSKNKKYMVTGPTANLLKVMNGGWTITWQGDKEELYPQEKNTLLEAIQEKIGKENVVYVEGVNFEKDTNSVEAIKKVKEVDAVIVCLGEEPYCETPGNITDLSLEKHQISYVEKLKAEGKPVILVLLEGRPRVLENAADTSDAVIVGYLPGMEGGNAIANILFGDVNPSGKLPFSYPKYPNGYTTYDHKPLEHFDVNRYDPLYPFGYGLSYTTFEYSELTLNKDSFNRNEEIEISVKVKNSGKLAGKESIELYLTDLVGCVSRPVKQLKRFTKIMLQPGEMKTISFTLNENDMMFMNRENKMIAQPGEFKVQISDLEETFTLNK